MTQTVIAQTFTDSLAKLTLDEQKQAKQTFVDIQLNPKNPGLQYHRIDRSRDKNFWSVRVNRDIRIIVHKMGSDGGTTTMIAYVAHHDDAYYWAERRRIDIHPKTGAVQIVEVRELFEEAFKPAESLFEHAAQASETPVLAGLKSAELLDIGVPEDWVDDLLSASEGQFLTLCDHIPGEAAEKLLVYATDGVLPVDQGKESVADPLVQFQDPYQHPDAQRRFRVLENIEDFERALEFPWEKWMLYLHPSQEKVVHASFSGPARVAGSAGTGKTVVAIHRAARVLRERTDSRLLVTTFSRQLASSLQRKLWMMVDDEEKGGRVRVLSFDGLAIELFTLSQGHEPRLATAEYMRGLIADAVDKTGIDEFRHKFISSEWEHVVDAWQLKGLQAYETVPRIGRRQRLGKTQRSRLWQIFDRMISQLAMNDKWTIASVKDVVHRYYSDKAMKPFTNIVVDEAQDLSVTDLRLLSAISDNEAGSLFFAGDLGQRIFQEPFSWAKLGVEVRGRSHTLKVNYRTSHQIRSTLDHLLPETMRDADGNADERNGTVSIFNGPLPQINVYGSVLEEKSAAVGTIVGWLKSGIEAGEIAVFVRSEEMLVHVRDVVTDLGLEAVELSRLGNPNFLFDQNKLNIGTMHQAKGLEFKSVLVMGCNDNYLPLETRVDEARDVDELNSIIETERHLLYVAATRAREFLVLTAVEPASEFLADLET